MNMTIKEYIESNMGQNVKIGFSEGFIYCDTISNKTLGELNGLSASYLQNLKEQKAAYSQFVKSSTKELFETMREKRREKAKEIEDKIKLLTYERDLKDDIINDITVQLTNLGEVDSKRKETKRQRLVKKLERIQKKDYNTALTKLENELKATLDMKVIDKRERIRKGTVKQKKDSIKLINKNIKAFVPFSECEIKDIYESSIEPGVYIITLKNNEFVRGNFWDSDEYHKRNAIKMPTRSNDYKDESVDSLLKFFASEYCQILLGKIDRRYLVNKILESEIYIVK